MSILLFSVLLLMLFGALWGIAVGEREAYTWKQGIARKNFSFSFLDYHGNRMIEVFSIFASLILIAGIDLLYSSKVFLVIALLAFMHIFYRASYNLNYYGYMWVDRKKIDNVYKVFNWKIPHLSTKLLIVIYTVVDLGMALCIYLNEVNWNL